MAVSCVCGDCRKCRDRVKQRAKRARMAQLGLRRPDRSNPAVKVSARPACMDAEEYTGWAKHNPYYTRERSESPCDDCLTIFALEMRAQDRCDGIPLGFEEDQEDEVIAVDDRMTALSLLAGAKKSRERQLRIDEAVRLQATGLTNAAIARAMGVDRSTVGYYLSDARRVA